jgi:hypothetical protein
MGFHRGHPYEKYYGLWLGYGLRASSLICRAYKTKGPPSLLCRAYPPLLKTTLKVPPQGVAPFKGLQGGAITLLKEWPRQSR